MTKVTTTQRIVNTKVSKTLAMLLVSSGFVMTLPVAMMPTSAFAQTVGAIQCGNGTIVVNGMPQNINCPRLHNGAVHLVV